MNAILPIRPRITPAQARDFDLSIQPIIKQIVYLEGFRATQIIRHGDGTVVVIRGPLSDGVEETIVLLKSVIERAQLEQFGLPYEQPVAEIHC